MLHKVITLANFKGGVGKSTSTAAIGACLAMKGYKVLLVDLDGQSNLTLYYVPNADIMEDSIFDTLVSGKAIPIINVKPNLDIVPSSLGMSSAEIAMTNTLAREQVLSRALSDVKINYDFILIDCPPSLGIVTTNAFIAADEILVPMTPELLPLKGMKMLDSFVSSLKVVRPSVKLSGVFITRYNHRKLNKAVSEALKKRYADITFKTIIRENISIAESAGSGQSIFLLHDFPKHRMAHHHSVDDRAVVELEVVLRKHGEAFARAERDGSFGGFEFTADGFEQG